MPGVDGKISVVASPAGLYEVFLPTSWKHDGPQTTVVSSDDTAFLGISMQVLLVYMNIDVKNRSRFQRQILICYPVLLDA